MNGVRALVGHANLDHELVYIGEQSAKSGKPVYAPYNPFMAAWFKYR